MDETTETEATDNAAEGAPQTAAVTTEPGVPVEAAVVEQEAEAAPGVADALASDTAQPVNDPTPNIEAAADAHEQQAAVEHPVLTSMREEMNKIANMPAHIWQQIEDAFDRVAQTL